MWDNVGIMDCELQIACKTDTATSVSLLGTVHCCGSRGKFALFYIIEHFLIYIYAMLSVPVIFLAVMKFCL